MLKFLKLPERLKGNLVTAAVEAELYDLNVDAAVKQRALKVYFDNRASDAAKLDAEAGHPFLGALHAARAAREARMIRATWDAYDKARASPSARGQAWRTRERRLAETGDAAGGA